MTRTSLLLVALLATSHAFTTNNHSPLGGQNTRRPRTMMPKDGPSFPSNTMSKVVLSLKLQDSSPPKTKSIRKRLAKKVLKVNQRMKRHLTTIAIASVVWRGGLLGTVQPALAARSAPAPAQVSTTENNNKAIPGIAAVVVAAGAGTVIVKKIGAQDDTDDDKESGADKKTAPSPPQDLEGADFDTILKSKFPKALTNVELETKVVAALTKKGFNSANTLLATSLCCDELARSLEKDLVKVYGTNFNLGGLAGFPFAGNTGFGAMAAHIPDDGFSLIVYGPHVGITQDGTVGKVERKGIALVDNCCGSAIAASGYVKGITEGGATPNLNMRSFTDFQQNIVQQFILPHGSRLSEAQDRMVELPYALYDSQDLLMRDIVAAGVSGTKKGTVLLGGIQINTSPDSQDYFHPLRFDYMNNKGEIVEDLLSEL